MPGDDEQAKMLAEETAKAFEEKLKMQDALGYRDVTEFDELD